MAWFDKKKRLRDAQEQLVQADAKVPARAKEFHLEVSDTLGDIEEASRKIGYDSAHVDSLCDQAAALVKSATPLASLIKNVVLLENEIDGLRARAEAQTEGDLAAFSESRCTGWLTELKLIGARGGFGDNGPGSGRATGPDTLSRIQAAIRQHAAALDRLIEVASLVERLGKGAATAHLEAESLQFREKFLRQSVTPQDLDSLDRQVEPVRRAADAPPPPPPEPPTALRELQKLIPEAFRWVRVFRSGEAEIRAINDEFARLEHRTDLWHDPKIEEVRLRARNLIAELRASATHEKDTHLSLFSEWIGYYEQACEVDPGLQNHLSKLRQMPATESAEFESWRSTHAEALVYFNGIAQARLQKLADYCRARGRDLSQAIASLRTQRIRRALHLALDDLERRIAALDKLDNRERTLEALHKMGEMGLSFDRLDAQAQTEFDEYQKDKTQKVLRGEVIRGAATTAGIDFQLDDFTDSADGELDSSLARLNEFSEHLRKAEAELSQSLTALIDRRNEFCTAAAEALRHVPGIAFTGFTPPARGSSLTELAAQCAAAKRVTETLTVTLTKAAESLGSKIEELRLRLEEIAASGDGNATIASDYIDQISFCEDPDLLEKNRALAALAAQCENFLWDVDKDKRDGEKKRTELRRRWREFFELGLRRYFTRHDTRVMALLNGIPENPPDWAAATAQLQEVERILGHLDVHARRVAAADMERACRIVAARAIGAVSPEKERLAAILEDGQRYRDQFPPGTVRRRALEAAGIL